MGYLLCLSIGLVLGFLLGLWCGIGVVKTTQQMDDRDE
jgi:hypothetical protein